MLLVHKCPRRQLGHGGCTVLANGDLEVDGKTFTSPSDAGQYVRRGATNGWSFWELPDGRRLTEGRSCGARRTQNESELFRT